MGIVIVMLDNGIGRGRPTCLGDKSRTWGVISQARHHLKDPDEGIRTTDRRVVMHHSEGKEGIVNLDFVSSVKTVFFDKVARVYYHNHISIAYLLYYMN